MMNKLREPCIFLAAAAAIACGGDGTPASRYTLAAEIFAEPVRDIDLLFVIDNSGSMQEEQVSLAARANDALFDVLRLRGGDMPNLHIGVVSTSLGAHDQLVGCSGDGDGGALMPEPAASQCTAVNGRYLIDEEDGNGGRTGNYTGPLESAFSCMVQLGTLGCGFEQPLEAMRRALDDSNPQNAGFLREHALLAVVIVSDEDDCSVFDRAMFDPSDQNPAGTLGVLSSFRCFDFGVTCDEADNREPGAKTDCQPRSDSPYMTDVQEYVAFLRGLKHNPSMVVAAGIFGSPEPVVVEIEPFRSGPALAPSCSSAAGEASPGIRLQAFLDGFPGRSWFDSICRDDLATPLTNVAKRIADSAAGSPCLYGALADVAPDEPGVQLDCRVSALDADATVELPACDKGAEPCFTLISDPIECGHTPTQVAVDISPSWSAIAGQGLRVECVVP